MLQLPAEVARLMNTAQLPQLYEQAKNALAECEKLDECAEWADKAAAIASYARQADDVELENWARRIRARAVRRCGELLRTFDARGRSKSEIPLVFKSRTAVAQEAGLTAPQCCARGIRQSDVAASSRPGGLIRLPVVIA